MFNFKSGNFIYKVKVFLERARFKVQRAVMLFSLFLLYFIGFGLTALLVFAFKLAVRRRKKSEAGSFWLEASGYQPDMEDALKQS